MELLSSDTDTSDISDVEHHTRTCAHMLGRSSVQPRHMVPSSVSPMGSASSAASAEDLPQHNKVARAVPGQVLNPAYFLLDKPLDSAFKQPFEHPNTTKVRLVREQFSNLSQFWHEENWRVTPFATFKPRRG